MGAVSALCLGGWRSEKWSRPCISNRDSSILFFPTKDTKISPTVQDLYARITYLFLAFIKVL